MNRLWTTLFLVGGMIQGTAGFPDASFGQDQTPVPDAPAAQEAAVAVASRNNDETVMAGDKKPKLEEIAPEASPIGGLLQFHRKKDQLFMELTSGQLNTDYIIIISIARGLGDTSLYGGMTWDFGEDMIWQFRKIDDRIQIVRRNFRYQAPPGTPEAKAIQTAFTDSILYSLPIVATGPNGGDVVDLSPIFMSDLPMISSYALPGFSFARERSTWKTIKGLKENMELEVSATYAGSGTNSIETVMDARGISIDVHYSISKLPNTGYQPRLADERVGYFNTVLKDFSKNAEDNNFVRYINRWNLQKLEPNAQYSLPKKPIVFWLEKTIPYQYRKPLRDGILEWNKAFERAGFYNAIEVRQQEDADEWDPEDVNYNTIRWSAAGLGFSIGPSRVNPMTGEILDADVVLDVGFISSWNRTFELYSPDDLAKQFSGEASFANVMFDGNQSDSFYRRSSEGINERLFMSQQMGFAETFFDIMACEDPKPEEPKAEEPKPEEPKAEEPKAEEPKAEEPKPEEPKAEEPKAEEPKPEEPKAEEPKPEEPKAEEPKTEEPKAEESKEPETPKKNYEEEREKVIRQSLQFLATHEVGHTLGLRHNFKLSSLLTLEELNDPAKTAEYGYAGSVMEYLPVNIMPKGMQQGEYSPTKLGQYDYWVIEYGYKPFGKGTDAELEELKKIAERQTQPELNYATDEDCYGTSVDPLVNIFDLGKSPLEYAKLRARLVKEILPGLNDRIVKSGESYNKMRSRFAALLSWHGSGMTFAARYIGGIHVNRDFKGDPNARPPFEVVSAQEQRDALAFLNEEVFGVDSYNIPANIYNYLAPNRWRHWGSNISSRYDVDIHESVLSWQTAVLRRLLSPATLSRLADSELRVAPDQDVFTSAEMVESLTTAVFKELETLKEGKFSIQNQAIRSIRRNLQRSYYEMLAQAALNSSQASAGEADFYALARLQLSRIRTNIQSVLSGNAELDPYTRAHLTELEQRISQTLDASIQRSL